MGFEDTPSDGSGMPVFASGRSGFGSNVGHRDDARQNQVRIDVEDRVVSGGKVDDSVFLLRSPEAHVLEFAGDQPPADMPHEAIFAVTRARPQAVVSLQASQSPFVSRSPVMLVAHRRAMGVRRARDPRGMINC